MAGAPQQVRAMTIDAFPPNETDRPLVTSQSPLETSLRQDDHSEKEMPTRSQSLPPHCRHTTTHTNSSSDGGGGRIRERRRLSSTPSTSMNSHSITAAATTDVGAPSVWTTPDWASHPVIENFYGHAPRRTRVNSFYEVMQSPTNTLATRTLAENCNSYGNGDTGDDSDGHDDENDDDDDGRRDLSKIKGNVRVSSTTRATKASRTMLMQPTRKLGSFSYSYTTETSDDAVAASPSFSTSTADSGYESRRVHHGDRIHERGVRSDKTRTSTTSSVGGGAGYAHWNRQRLQSNATMEMVPTPHPHGRMKKPAEDAVQHMTRQHQQEMMQQYSTENPQGGHASPRASSPSPSSSSSSSSSSENASSIGGMQHRPALTSSRLKSKLQECLRETDDRIDVEAAMARDAYACMARSTKAASVSKRESLMWSLLCGARPTNGGSGSRFGGAAVSFVDGISFLHERLAVACHHRALNQLQRHRRHVNGILQIVTSHNPDLNLTEKQLDSFECVEAMLANDIKYALLQRQVEALATTIAKRQDALRHAKIKNGRDCFDVPRVKSAMLAKLLEAVSWYRLVQTNSRDESASTSVGLSAEASAAEAKADGRREHTHVDGEEHHEASLSSHSSGSSSSISASRSLQELQVERILSVLAGEEFYSDYNELMCQPDWWEIAQAHFENIIFSKAESRVCQWVNRVSREVAAVCHEPLEDEQSLRLGAKHDVRSKNATMAAAAAAVASQAPAEWTKDPQPEQIIEFIDRVTRRIRREFDVPADVTKSLHAFVQRMVFPRLALVCFNQKTMIDCQRKDKLWRKRCVDLSGIPLENLGVVADLAAKMRSKLPSRRVAGGRKSFLIRAIDAFNCMASVVPCDLLDELMYGVVILHHEAALVLGTTQFSVETFFPLLTYVLVHCHLPTIHAQLHLLENFAITNSNVNGEESYYVYCVHAAVEYVCNSAGLTTTAPVTAPAPAAPVVAPVQTPVDVAATPKEAPVSPRDPIVVDQKREPVVAVAAAME